MTLQQEAVQSSCRGGGGWSRQAVGRPWPTTAHEGLRIRGCLTRCGLRSRVPPPARNLCRRCGEVRGREDLVRGLRPLRQDGPRRGPCPLRVRRREPHQNCTTVPPSMMTGGSAEPVRYSLTNSAARLDDSSVPVIEDGVHERGPELGLCQGLRGLSGVAARFLDPCLRPTYRQPPPSGTLPSFLTSTCRSAPG